MTTELWAALAAALAAALGIAAAVLDGWQLRAGRLVRHRGRHRAATRRRPGADAVIPTGTEAAEPDVAEPDVAEDIELVLSPQTGRISGKGVKVPDEEPSSDAVPAARVTTSGAAPVTSGPRVDSVPVRPWLLTPLTLDDGRRRELLAQAWQAQDVDALAAQAGSDEHSALAGFTLAGWLGRRAGDPRAEHWLYQGFQTGQDPRTDALLEPYLADLTFHAAFPAWGLDEDLPCSREALAVTVAAEEVRTGDLDAAYGVLLDAEVTERVGTLRALVALELAWWTRTLAAAGAGADAPWRGLRAVATGTALARTGQFEDALALLDESVLEHRDGGTVAEQDGFDLLTWLLFVRADVRRELGDSEGAWEDLTAVIERSPTYPGAVDALKLL